MAKSKECTIIFNTMSGYCMQPIKCESIAEALRLAHKMQMAFRVFIDGKLHKSGWYTE